MKKRIIIVLIVLIIFFAFILNILQKEKGLENIGSYPSYTNDAVEEASVEVPIDFEGLKGINDEIYAWISIPGTDIEYPILQSRENVDFYLKNNVNNKKSSHGAIFTQFYNSTDFNDFNTLIYGHAMKDGTMFGSLKKYKDEKFFKKNQFIKIYMPNRVLDYQIFAAYTFDDRNIVLTYNFSGIMDRQMYLDTILSVKDKDAIFNENIELDTNDRIITLSTCTNNGKERFLVQAVLISDSDING